MKKNLKKPPWKILYVEDSPEDAELLIEFFGTHAKQFEILIAKTGHEALDWFDKKVFDLILLDNNLPDINGIDILKKLRVMKTVTPVVLITGAGDENVAINALRIGASEYVTKRGNYLVKLPATLEKIIRESHKIEQNHARLPITACNVLYIEKYERDIELTRQYLADLAPQINLIIARTSNAGLELLGKKTEIDLILMDLRMPDIDAMEFLKELRRRNITKPVIIVTGGGDEEKAVAAIRLGAYDYIVKREHYLTRFPYAIYNAIDKFTFDKINRELREKLDERIGELEKLAAELKAFAHSISSNLRVPLRAVDGFTRRLQKDYSAQLEPEGRRFLDIIRQNTGKMEQMLKDLYHLSRVSNSDLKMVKIDMESVARSVFEKEASPDEKKKTKLTIARLPVVTAHAQLIKQVWSNLFTNALKFTTQKEHREIQVGYREEPGEWVFWVKDNGVGFDQRLSDKLFCLFQRLHKESDFGGTGVGLTIVRRIIYQHRGRVWAEGRPGDGATFFFSLPRDHVSFVTERQMPT